MPKKQNPKSGGLKCLLQPQTLQKFKNQQSSRSIPHCSDSIKSSTTNCSHMTDSPYKNAVSQIKPINFNKSECDDFKTPITTEKEPKVFQRKPVLKKSKKKKRDPGQSSITKFTKDNLANSDVNPDHLQMALALSKSSFETENPCGTTDNSCTDLLSILSPRKNSTLERFGFRSNKPKLPMEYQRLNIREGPKTRKYSKFRFITPTLLTRTEADRESLITQKISVILTKRIDDPSCVNSHPEETPVVISDNLQSYVSVANKFICLNNANHEFLKSYCFCVNDLSINFTRESTCGCLLKKWEDIPGREKSPEKIKTTEKIMNENDTVSINVRRSTSPDLFDSDYESCTPNHSQKVSLSNDIIKQTPIKSLFRSDSGIEHYESFCDSFSLSQDKIAEDRNESNNASIIDSSQSSICTEEKNSVNNNDPENFSTNKSLRIGVTPEDVLNCSKKMSYENSQVELQEQSNLNNSELNNAKQTEISPDLEISHINSTTVSSNKTIIVIDLSDSEGEEEDFKENYDEGIVTNNKCLRAEEKNQFKNFDSSTVDTSKIENNSVNTSNQEKSSLNCTSTNVSTHTFLNSIDKLDITKYVNNILHQKSSPCDENNLDCSQLTNDDDNCQLSQESSDNIVDVSDEELNYSSYKSNQIKSYNFYELSSTADEEMKKISMSPNSDDIQENIEEIHLDLRAKYCKDKSENKLNNISDTLEDIKDSDTEKEYFETPKKNKSTESDFPNFPSYDDYQADNDLALDGEIGFIDCCNESPEDPEVKNITELNCPHWLSPKAQTSSTSLSGNAATPKQNFIIKTKDITPMLNYDEMSTPKIIKELDKYGMKPLKRKRGIQMLKYIYDCTHPFVDSKQTHDSDNEKDTVIKRRKTSPKEKPNTENEENNINFIKHDLLQKETNDDLIFERKFSKKILSCALPLQIAWHNFIEANPEIHKNILIYEPMYLEVLHTMLQQQSNCKFHIKIKNVSHLERRITERGRLPSLVRIKFRI